MLRVPRAGLNQEFIPPRVETLERGRIRDVEGENTAVGSAIEGHPERLEALLASRVPNLQGSFYTFQTILREKVVRKALAMSQQDHFNIDSLSNRCNCENCRAF